MSKHLLRQVPVRHAAKIVVALLLLALVYWMADVEAIIARLARFPLTTLGIILLLLTANLWLVAFRFWRVLAHFGIRVPWAVASRASLSGHVGGLVVISLFGQVAGRHTVLRNHGVSPLVNASLAGYERALLAIISGTLALLGGIYLLGRQWAADIFLRMPLLEIGLLVLASTALSLWIGRSAFETGLSKRVLAWQNLVRVIWIASLTAAGQMLILGSFVLAILAFQPQTPILLALAAAAVISFAASLPITIGGWGVREIAAVFILGKLGIPAADAATAAIVIGLGSTLMILAATPFTFRRKPMLGNSPSTFPASTHSVLEIEKAAAWLLGMAVAVTIFFQVHVALPGGVLNLNLADPFAILALAAVSLHAMMLGQPPQWRIATFNRMLLLFTGLLLVGFVNGWLQIGVTQWALGGRLLGWLVLLGYLSAGYLLVAHAGAKGARRLGETLAVAAVVVILWQAASRVLYQYGWDVGQNPTPNFEGYSGNRNAFAFQLLAVMALLLAYSHLYTLQGGARHWTGGLLRVSLLLGVVLTGIVWTGSRAGILTGTIMLLVGAWSGRAERRAALGAALLAGLLWSGVWLVQSGPVQSIPVQSVPVQSALSADSSDHERWDTWVHAFKLWRESPFIGAGLGVFVAKSPAWWGHPGVIHSTPLWVLAEFGLLGEALFGWMLFRLAQYALPAVRGRTMPRRVAFLLLLLTFVVFSLFHEMFYQRILWLVMGALLALPGAAAVPGRASGQ
jgi:uncharacterized membrane protein YbhN (UPF0104 family)